jgi:hypothetical protein
MIWAREQVVVRAPSTTVTRTLCSWLMSGCSPS